VSEAARPAPLISTTPATPGLTSVVIVAADSGVALQAAVADALASTAPVEVIVVDNASTDRAVDEVALRWSGDARLLVVRNAANVGFGSGCNRGAGNAHGDVLLFLNPDCRLPVDAVATLRAASDARSGVLGARIVDAAGRVEPASRRRDPLLRRALMTMSGLSRFEARWPALAGVDLPPAADPGARERVDAVSGALLFVPRPVFEQVGGFDERYFLHAEDLDLCRRVRDAGFRVAIDARVRVAHAQGGSSRSRPLFVARHKARGLWRWFTTFDPAARNPLLRAIVFAGIWLHFALRAPLLGWRQWRAGRG
jgi:GT2 family glycosyltransferase